MVLEQLLKVDTIVKKPSYSLLIGTGFTFLSFATSYLLFRDPSLWHVIGISTILFTVMLTVPTLYKLLKYEEKVGAEQESFLKEHKGIINFFIYYFIGVFIAFFILSILFPNLIFSKTDLYGSVPVAEQAIQSQVNNLPLPPVLPNAHPVFDIFKSNLYVLAICFFLSLLYGIGALFIIVLNASIFASSLVNLIRIQLPAALGFINTYSFISCNLGIMLFHTIPEMGAYLLAAISGGLISQALLKEKFGSNLFKNVLKDSGVMLLLSIIILYAAAAIEMLISKNLFASNACLKNLPLVMIITILLIVGVIALEVLRRKKTGSEES